MRRPAILLALLVAATVGCATGGGSSTTPRRQADLITMQELSSSDSPNLFIAIQRLRPTWLRSRGQVSINNPEAGEPVVYLDDTRMGGISTLEQIVPAEVSEVRRLSSADATNRYGTGHAGGAIVVRRRTGP